MSKTTPGRHAAAKTSILRRVRAAIARRAAQSEAQYTAWAKTNTNLEGFTW